MIGIFVIATAIPAIGLWLRGSRFHNHLVKRCAGVFQDRGFCVVLECPVRHSQGTDFIDLLAWRGSVMIACEVETTPRNVVANARHAMDLAFPLFVVVPNRRVRSAVIGKLRRELPAADWGRIWIFLPDEVCKGLTNYLAKLSSANGCRKIGKTN